MQFYQEITEWEGDIPNHIYLLSDDKSKAFAYVRKGTDKVFEFSVPIAISMRGRKFKTVPNTFGYEIKAEKKVVEKPVGEQFTVTGSKGDKYVVTKLNGQYSCNCTGFMYRGKCKHADEIKATA